MHCRVVVVSKLRKEESSHHQQNSKREREREKERGRFCVAHVHTHATENTQRLTTLFFPRDETVTVRRQKKMRERARFMHTHYPQFAFCERESCEKKGEKREFIFCLPGWNKVHSSQHSRLIIADAVDIPGGGGVLSPLLLLHLFFR